MDRQALYELLDRVRRHDLDVDAAAQALTDLPYSDLGFARVDHHRALRRGLPEVIFGQGKTAAQIAAVLSELASHHQNAIATRVTAEAATEIRKTLPDATYDPVARIVSVSRRPVEQRGKGVIAVVAAGTSDIPVAEEAAVTAGLFGNAVERIYDVGVAGLHRLLAQQDALRRANVLIVVAGMEGALPSVVGGLVARPVIAVPTSVGYGASFGGITALLAMLNSCSSGVTVVNIDNGFGAAYAATLMNRDAED